MKQVLGYSVLMVALGFASNCTLNAQEVIPLAKMESGAPIAPLDPDAEAILLRQLGVGEIHSVRFRTDSGVFILRGSRFEGEEAEGLVLEGPINIAPAAVIEDFSAGSTFFTTGSPGCEWEWHDGRWVLVSGDPSQCILG